MRLFTAALATMAFFGARADAFTVKTTENPVQCNEFTVEWYARDVALLITGLAVHHHSTL